MVFEVNRGSYLVSTAAHCLDFVMIHACLSEESYWAQGRTAELVRKSIENSIPFGVYFEDRQIGFARVVTDKATFAWLADVFILKDFRGKGLGLWLVESVMKHPELQGLRRFVLATLDAHDLYRRVGFSCLIQPERWMSKYNPSAPNNNA